VKNSHCLQIGVFDNGSDVTGRPRFFYLCFGEVDLFLMFAV